MANSHDQSLLTIATIRRPDNQPARVLFNERAAIFTLADEALSSPAAARTMSAPRGARAVKAARTVLATLDTERGLVLRLDEPAERDLVPLAAARAVTEKFAKPVTLNVARIDPTAFNFVDIAQKWPAFSLCNKIVPSYAKAKEIFDDLARLSCNLPGPYAETPCIPFQYVRDGCYARAHQMRRIITTRYGYCCEKVFSFANEGNDTLAVKADKWGGCCVTWWYHVAPLIRVKMRIRTQPAIMLTLAMVLDPGMFDKPVLLSSWLEAQENTLCSSSAHVSRYSIQPGTAYWPGNYAGTSFGTDPDYAKTESTLQAYAQLKTCT